MVILTETETAESFELLDLRVETLIESIGESACADLVLGPRQLAYLQHWDKRDWWLLISEHSSEASARAPYGEGERHFDRLYHRTTRGSEDLLVTASREGVGDLWMDNFANFDCRTTDADKLAIGQLLTVLSGTNLVSVADAA